MICKRLLRSRLSLTSNTNSITFQHDMKTKLIKEQLVLKVKDMKTKQTGIKELNKAKARLVDWHW